MLDRSDEYYHETKTHADRGFPYNIYPCTIPLDFQQVPIHWHQEMEIIVIKKGSGVVTADLIRYEVQSGDIIVIFPGQLHGIGQDENTTMEYENIIFQLEMLMTMNEDSCTMDVLVPLTDKRQNKMLHIHGQHDQYHRFLDCINMMDTVNEQRPAGYQLAIKGALFQFLYLILLTYPMTGVEKSSRAKEKMKIVLTYIETHYSGKITVAQAAAMCFYSKSHFMKYFKQYMGVSFIEYLNDYRLSAAAAMLMTTSKPVITVAIENGFDNISYFNRLFKRRYHQSPQVYRRL